MKTKICIVIGTRPEIIKMAPVIKACKKRKVNFFIIHTGQHYSYNMDALFMKELGLPNPNYNLAVGSGSHGSQTAKILEGIETILMKEQPSVILVQGDTNSVLAGALAASKINIKVGHIEAGLRSYDNTMPEETNRIITDHISNFLFAPTSLCKDILLSEGIKHKKIFNVGNTIVDAVYENIGYAEKISKILSRVGLLKKEYILVTAHRAENVDNKKKLKDLITGVEKIQKYSNLKIVWPIHPRTLSSLKKFNLNKDLFKIKNLVTIDPVGYFDSLILQKYAKVILTDSGGLQEESCILGTPCLTLRSNTERPESVTVGANILTGTHPALILKSYKVLLLRKKAWTNPFGNGKSSEKILDILLKHEYKLV